MAQLPFLHSYGERSIGEGVPVLTIGITRDGKTGMSGRELARLFRCSPLRLPKLIYGNTGGFSAYKNGTFDGKTQSGHGISVRTTHCIPRPHRAAGTEVHLFPSELIARAANQRQLDLARQGKDHPPLTAFVEYCIAQTLDTVIKEALEWEDANNALLKDGKVKSYSVQDFPVDSSRMTHEVLREWYQEIRKSYKSLVCSRGQLLRRLREAQAKRLPG